MQTSPLPGLGWRARRWLQRCRREDDDSNRLSPVGGCSRRRSGPVPSRHQEGPDGPVSGDVVRNRRVPVPWGATGPSHERLTDPSSVRLFRTMLAGPRSGDDPPKRHLGGVGATRLAVPVCRRTTISANTYQSFVSVRAPNHRCKGRPAPQCVAPRLARRSPSQPQWVQFSPRLPPVVRILSAEVFYRIGRKDLTTDW